MTASLIWSVLTASARFGFDVWVVWFDAGYATSAVARGLEERGILGVTGYRRSASPKPGMMAKKHFAYELETDGYGGPGG